MKRFLYLFLSGIALLTACQNNPPKQTDKDIQNIDSIKQKTKADSIKQTANIDSIKQVLAKTTDPLKRIKLHEQVIDLTIEAATPEERCRIFDDFNTQVEKSYLKSTSMKAISLTTITNLGWMMKVMRKSHMIP